MNLIANTGIQFLSIPVRIDRSDNEKMYFHEWFDGEEGQRKLEIAHFFADDEVWVKKIDLHRKLGLAPVRGRVGYVENEKFIQYQWEDIKDDFPHSMIEYVESDDGSKNCFDVTVKKCKWEKFENRWLPCPFFLTDKRGRSLFGPTNWSRMMLCPKSTDEKTIEYTLLLAFDTKSLSLNDEYEEEDVKEMPSFSIEKREQKYAMCDDEYALVDFCSKKMGCEWVDEYVIDIYHSTQGQRVSKVDDLKCKKPKMRYLAEYIFIMRHLQDKCEIPTITLYNDSNAEHIDVDMVIDMGNSRSSVILFDNHDFTKVSPLQLQNFTCPVKNGILNKPNINFEMRLAFRKADFGVNTIVGSNQFVYPSMVRLGREANELIHKATSANTGKEKVSTCSSPKRYLWDDALAEREWEFINLPEEDSSDHVATLKGISKQLNEDGTLNFEGEGSIRKNYSRKALMTLSILEILAQARMQINSYDYRHGWGEESSPRRVRRIIMTCPTAMSGVEQRALHRCCEDAYIMLDRFVGGKAETAIDEKEARKKIVLFPNITCKKANDEVKEWIYDEATCSQFVFLYSELAMRYHVKDTPSNCRQFFELLGKGGSHTEKKGQYSLTVGSIDMGAGTTDMMIASYNYDDSGQCKLTPTPLFWESFYLAGDDLLRRMIETFIIEGPHAEIPKKMSALGIGEKNRKILDFFVTDNSRQLIPQRRLRNDFNLQVSIPLVSYYLMLLNNDKTDEKKLRFADVFGDNPPNPSVLDEFERHFGFRIEEIEWHYDRGLVEKVIRSRFGKLIEQLSAILERFECDIVLLAGRPMSLKVFSDMFVEYGAISDDHLITMNNYKVGTWYPFQDGTGYLGDTKSMVTVGAMIANCATEMGSLNGFSLDLSLLAKKMQPTTDYFSIGENEEAFISPNDSGKNEVKTNMLPLRIWTRQVNSCHYPTRPFYYIDFDRSAIKKELIEKHKLDSMDKGAVKDAMEKHLDGIRKRMPFTFSIIREDYENDKERLVLDEITDKDGESLPLKNFKLHVRSLSEADDYWMDTGAFDNLQSNEKY